MRRGAKSNHSRMAFLDGPTGGAENVAMKRILFVAFILVVPFLARGNPPDMSGHGASDWMGTELSDAHEDFFLWYTNELGLTEAQTIKLNKLKMSASEDRKKIWRSLHRARVALHTLLDSETPSAKEVDRKAEEIGELQGKLIGLRAKTILEEKKVLTKEQLKKFDELMLAGPATPQAKP